MFDPDDKPIGDLLFDRKPFQVPKYQRAYAWTEEHIDDFNADLFKCYSRRSKGINKSYFFGGIVSILRSVAGRPTGFVYELVDGQQRIATFLILFHLISEAAKELSIEATNEGDSTLASEATDLSNAIRDEFIVYNTGRIKSGGPPIRITLSNADREYFEDYINRSPSKEIRESHKRIASAQKRIQKDLINRILIDSLTVAEKVTALKHLSDAATDDCHVIHLVSDSRAEAYRLFQVLNDRGVGLSEGDLLRSITLEFLDEDKFKSIQSKVEKYWDSILSGRDSRIKSFLVAYYISFTQKRPNKHRLFDDFNEEYFPYDPDNISKTDANLISKQISNMQHESEIYNLLADGMWPYDSRDPRIGAWDIQRLEILVKTLKHTLALPLLLTATKLKQSDFADLIQLLERFVFRYIIVCKQHSSPLSEIYYKYAVQIRKNSSIFSLNAFKDELKKLKVNRADDQLFKTNLPQRMVYEEKKGNGELRYFLITLEYFYRWYRDIGSGKPECLDKSFLFDITQNNIEHIYPKNPKAADRIAGMVALRHQLGNLTFWSQDDNYSAGNDKFADKKNLYNKSRVELTKKLGRKKTWKVESINGREKELTNMAIKIFSV